MSISSMKELTLEFMMDYIERKDPSFKPEFKKAALRKNKNGDVRYNAAAARYAFCNKFVPELIPKKKGKKPTKTQILEKW